MRSLPPQDKSAGAREASTDLQLDAQILSYFEARRTPRERATDAQTELGQIAADAARRSS